MVQLSVSEEQKNFVATNTQSILEAYVTVTSGHVALPFGIYEEDTLVGFVMLGYGNTEDEGEPKIASGNYCIWRYMIDQRYQGKGYGSKALDAVIEYIRTMPCGKAEYIWLSFEPENKRAEALYQSKGFARNGEMCEGEIVSCFKL